MNTTIVLFLVLYYVVVLGIGFWTMRRGAGRDLEGCLLGAGNQGWLVPESGCQAISPRAASDLPQPYD